MKLKPLNKKAQKDIGMGTVLVIIAALIAVYVLNPGGILDDFKDKDNQGGETSDSCPSSDLTSVTLNTQEALASSATDAQVDYYVYDPETGELVKNGNSGSDGQATFDVGCASGKQYDLLVINETTSTGYYPQQVTIDATDSEDTLNLKMYEYGQVNLVSVASSTDPTGGTDISAGQGKTCGWTLTFTENESVSAFNKPLIMCEVNVSVVAEVTSSDVTLANDKKPSRISASSGNTFYTFELDELVKSTDSAKAIDGKIRFLDSATVDNADSMDCRIVDQATFRKADYQTLSFEDGWVEGAENTETRNDVGAPDSGTSSLGFNSSATSYC